MTRLFYLILPALILAGCGEGQQASDAYGNFEATATTIGAEANGRLLQLRLEEGQDLKQGAMVGLVDTTALHLQRLQIEATINTLPKKLRNTLADIAVLKDQRSNLVRERDRVRRLLAAKAATPKQLDDLNGQIDVVDKQVEAIRSTTSTTNKSILAEQEPLLAQRAIIEEQIRKAYVRNPISGTVLAKLAEPMEIVGMGAPLYRIGKLDTMTLRFYVDAVQLQSLKLGQRIEVLTDAGADGFDVHPGRISWISSQAEFTPKTIQTKEDRVNLVYALKALVPNPEGRIKIGMPAEVNFSEARAEDAK